MKKEQSSWRSVESCLWRAKWEHSEILWKLGRGTEALTLHKTSSACERSTAADIKRVLINIYNTTGFIRLWNLTGSQISPSEMTMSVWGEKSGGEQQNGRSYIREQTKQSMNFRKISICISKSQRSPLARRRLRIEIKRFTSVQTQGTIFFPRSWYRGIWGLRQNNSNWWFLVG